MPNATLNRYLQNLGSGDNRALALLEFSGLVQTNFPTAIKFWPYIMKKAVSSGKSWQFPFVGQMSYIEHDAGTDLPGQAEPISEERTITCDDKEIVSHAWLTKVDDFIAHFDEKNHVAREAALALGRVVDSRCARMLAKGARQDARGANDEFDSGVLIRRNAASVSAGYPVSAAGSRALQDDLANAGQAFRERNIPEAMWTAWITPYLLRVLLRDNTIVSRDYVDAATGNKSTEIVSRVSNFKIEVTNQMPSTNVTTGEAAYQGNFSKTAALCMANPGAVGFVSFGGVEAFGPEWKTEKRAWLLGAAHFGGCKWLRPEACAEIYCHTSDYTLTDGEYGL